jgi:hypothetical protein
MAPKWMPFGDTGSRLGQNTVVLAGVPLRKNQLGNIELGVVSTLYPPGLRYELLRPANIIRVARIAPGVRIYDLTHPHHGHMGYFAGLRRADNIAAFGVGYTIAERILELERCKPEKVGEPPKAVPTREEIKTILIDLFRNARRLDRAASRFGQVLLKEDIGLDTLTFIEYYGGFNTRSLKVKPDWNYPVEAAPAPWYFEMEIRPMYQEYRNRMRQLGREPLSMDLFLRQYFESYSTPNGRERLPE